MLWAHADGAHLAAASERLPSVRADLTAAFRGALRSAYPAIEVEPVVSATNNAQHGDYQCNNAMQLFGRLKGKAGAHPPTAAAVGHSCCSSPQHVAGSPRTSLPITRTRGPPPGASGCPVGGC